jgi:hypothetical protein
MRIAFDMDGVLADLHASYVKAAQSLFPDLDRATIASGDVGASPPEDEREAPTEIPVAPPPLPVSRRQSEAIWSHLTSQEHFWESLAEIEEGSVARLAALSDERGWDVLFITSRPSSRGRTVQRQTQRWLQAKGFAMPAAYVVHGSRGQVARALALDVVVDDRANNCLDVVLESEAGAVLVWRGDHGQIPASARRLGIAVAPSVAVCLETLIEAEASAASGGTLLDRLRRVFGLRTRQAPGLLRRE